MSDTKALTLSEIARLCKASSPRIRAAELWAVMPEGERPADPSTVYRWLHYGKHRKAREADRDNARLCERALGIIVERNERKAAQFAAHLAKVANR